MKFLLMIILMVNVLSGIAQSGSSAEKEVWETVQQWNDAFEANDVDKYFEFLHDDVQLFIPSSPYRIEGKEVDKKEFVWSLSKEKTRVSLFQELQPIIRVSGNMAWVTYHNRGVYGTAGEEQMIYLKETNILLRENDSWKIIHIHVSQ